MTGSPCHLKRDLFSFLPHLREKAKKRSYRTNLILFFKKNSVLRQEGFQAA